MTSTDRGYTPSDPPTIEDWRHLERRADANKRRSRRGLWLGITAVVIALVLGSGGALIYLSQRDVPKVLDKQTVTLNKVNDAITILQRSQSQSDAQSKGSALAFAVILENIAAGFGTPPYPNPGRVKAVDNLCATAAGFRAKAGLPPVACPAI